MPRRRNSCLLAAFVQLTLASVLAAQPAPNVILLMGDDHGWDETGYNGHAHLHTPVLDEMARTGIRLDRFYSAHPSCSPTRASVMTGRHPVRCGTFSPNYSIRPEERTIAHILHDSGYKCGHFGKWHLGPVKRTSPTSPGAMGFDEWLSHDNFFEMNPTLSRNGATPEILRGEGSEVIVSEAISFIERSRDDDQPFFVVIWFGSPHEPYSGLAEDLSLYDDLPAEYAEQEFRLTSNETGRPTSRNLRAILRERYAEITAMDRAIGQLRDWLKESELRDDTLLWYCGDNGTPGDGIVTSPFRGKKGQMYDGGLRVPGIIEWPSGFPEPAVHSFASVTSDILPTLCGIAKAEVPNRSLDGIDIRPLIEAGATDRSKPIGFWTYDDSEESAAEPYLDAEAQRGTTPLVKAMQGIFTRNFTNFQHPTISQEDYSGERVWLTDRYKLIVRGDRQSAPERELFDIRRDPSESQNLATEHPDIAKSMEMELIAWQKSVLESLTGTDY